MHPLFEVIINGFILANIGTLILKDQPIADMLGKKLFVLLYGAMLFLGSNVWLIKFFPSR